MALVLIFVSRCLFPCLKFPLPLFAVIVLPDLRQQKPSKRINNRLWKLQITFYMLFISFLHTDPLPILSHVGLLIS